MHGNPARTTQATMGAPRARPSSYLFRSLTGTQSSPCRRPRRGGMGERRELGRARRDALPEVLVGDRGIGHALVVAIGRRVLADEVIDDAPVLREFVIGVEPQVAVSRDV